MPIYDMACHNCSIEREVIAHSPDAREKDHWLKCDSQSCKGRMRRFHVVDRHFPSALRFKDGITQWESNSKRAKQLREGKH